MAKERRSFKHEEMVNRVKFHHKVKKRRTENYPLGFQEGDHQPVDGTLDFVIARYKWEVGHKKEWFGSRKSGLKAQMILFQEWDFKEEGK